MDVARVRELENRVAELTNRNDIITDALNDIVHIAAQLKADLMNSKSSDGGNVEQLTKFCDNLMGLSLGVATHNMHLLILISREAERERIV